MLPAAEHVRALLLDLLLGEEGLRLGHDSVCAESVVRRVESEKREGGGRGSWAARMWRRGLDFERMVGAGMWREDLGRAGARSGRDGGAVTPTTTRQSDFYLDRQLNKREQE